MIDWYILDDANTPVKVEMLEAAKWLEEATKSRRKQAGRTTLESGILVSTVFLGLDHGCGDGPPLLFETMAFPKEGDFGELDCERCSTWEQALEQHELMVKKYKETKT